ncbi:hypothetical protein BS50DRAFT_210070 [Corynespora cassiicola Philippines]|uniref:Uncharacterized protein n=1 Tax=Corynespora cassiicola Philippines TaxID=1448308 RepID=A0A2T2N4U3_CORCC|nr:hypothetical protein BS50DRAFT_210070 [Corynespora cassiicola Philippines]
MCHGTAPEYSSSCSLGLFHLALRCSVEAMVIAALSRLHLHHKLPRCRHAVGSGCMGPLVQCLAYRSVNNRPRSHYSRQVQDGRPSMIRCGLAPSSAARICALNTLMSSLSTLVAHAAIFGRTKTPEPRGQLAQCHCFAVLRSKALHVKRPVR